MLGPVSFRLVGEAYDCRLRWAVERVEHAVGVWTNTPAGQCEFLDFQPVHGHNQHKR